MLGSLHGTVLTQVDTRSLIEVNGVGYWVFTGSWIPTGEVLCYLHHHIREDASTLFGFPSVAELLLFERLLSVSGVGPKGAMALLSLGTSEQVENAINQADITFLSRASGIGKKAAQKIVVELQGKINQTLLTPLLVEDDLTGALINLGLSRDEISRRIQKMPSELENTEEKLRWALSH